MHFDTMLAELLLQHFKRQLTEIFECVGTETAPTPPVLPYRHPTFSEMEAGPETRAHGQAEPRSGHREERDGLEI
jgi:hypothetical protein